MGPGLLESVYQSCLEEEFRIRGIKCDPQFRVPLSYKGISLSDYLVLDFFFPGELVLEIKAVDKIIPVFEAQLLTYLKLTNTRVGLLMNFNSPVLKDGLKRMVL